MEIGIASGCYGLDGYGEGVKGSLPYDYVVLKTTTLHPIEVSEHSNFIDVGNGSFWNYKGMENPGIENITLPEHRRVRLSLWADRPDDWRALFYHANKLHVEAFEINLSCPSRQLDMDKVDKVVDLAERPVYLKINRASWIPSVITGVVCGNSIPMMQNGVLGGMSGRACQDQNIEAAKIMKRCYPGLEVIGCGAAGTILTGRWMDAGVFSIQIGSSFYSKLVQSIA